MVQPSCVQVAVSTVAAFAPVRVSRNVPTDVCVMAIPPVDASGEPAPTGTETTRPLTDEVTDVNDSALDDGPVGLPPQPATAPSATKPAALPQQAQNSRRVGTDDSSSLITAVSSRGQISANYDAGAVLSKKHDKRDREPLCHPSALSAAIGLLTLALACLGIFGVAAYGVALGAQQPALLRAIVRQVIAFAAALSVFAAAGAVAALWPAYQVLRRNPIDALRHS